MKDKKLISLEIPVELLNNLQNIAKKKTISVSALIRLLISDFISKEELKNDNQR